MASLATSTNKQYDCHLASFKRFCTENNITDYLHVKAETVIEFLTNLFKQGKSYSTINSARSALSHFVTLHGSTWDAGKHPLTAQFMRGVYKLRPPTPKYNSTWDAKVVLDYLGKIKNAECSLKEITSKCAMLLALSTGQRVQTITALKMSTMISDREKRLFVIDSVLKTSKPGSKQTVVNVCRYSDPDICPVECLDVYIQRTSSLRTSEHLFVSLSKPHSNVTSQTIARWLSNTLRACDIDSFYTAHSIRAASTSKAVLNADINSVLKMAGWASVACFARHYHKPIESGDSFVKSVFSG
jgi:site-specific recombinase XerD